MMILASSTTVKHAIPWLDLLWLFVVCQQEF